MITDEYGRKGMGEGTPAQPGYQHETPEGIWDIKSHTPAAKGCSKS